MTKEEIKAAVQEGVRAELGQFYIEREQHYKDHLFIQSLSGTALRIKGTACKTITVGIITAILTLLVWGFKSWAREAMTFLGLGGKP